MKQQQLFKCTRAEAATPEHKVQITFKVDAGAAYEVICEALMNGSAPLDALITGQQAVTRWKSELLRNQRGSRNDSRRDPPTAEADLERESETSCARIDDWNPHLNDSWW